MNASESTPRLSSAFPQTPKSSRNRPPYLDKSNGSASFVKESPRSAQEDQINAPLIPLDFIDGPSQRLYVSAFYLGLTAWRVYDYFKLVVNEADSLWLFMKWVAIDGVFLYGLPGLRIPWLEWSPSTMTVLFLLHATLNGLVMFKVPFPQAWFLAIVKTMYDRELSVSENRVKPASLLHNPSLILGKQIIHILPEGSATLNPEQHSFCLDPSSPSIQLPILINQTNPILIELLRIDLETNTNETITISNKEAKKLKKQADKETRKSDHLSTRILRYSVKQTGLYRLQRVVDESNLEVQRRLSDTLVVNCPSASMKETPKDKCRGELSDFFLHVDATPPLKVKYSKTVNHGEESSVSLTVHPENLNSPLSQQKASGSLIKIGSDQVDVSWARTQHIKIPVNETLGIVGDWEYTIEEIHDGCGNLVNYTKNGSSGHSRVAKNSFLQQTFKVHQRPQATLYGCSPQEPLKVAKAKATSLPVWKNPTRQFDTGIAKLHITYSFNPNIDESVVGADTILKSERYTLGDGDRGPEISFPGVYSLDSVSTDYCLGEVIEPSTCLLLNPIEPDLSITSEQIPHKCAGNSVGLRVGLDLIGTPPFQVAYNIHRRSSGTTSHVETIKTTRTQLEFKPREAGHYTYEFMSITDSVYHEPRSLRPKNMRLEQDVKPTAFARFVNSSSQDACIQEPAEFGIDISGDPPWSLEYDLVHEGKRKKHKVQDITSRLYKLVTPNLDRGGQYTLLLTSITDSSGCKIFLEQEAKVHVRHQRPGAAFGLVEGKRTAQILEGRKLDLPLRLSGEPPWMLTYMQVGDLAGEVRKKQAKASNDVLSIDSKGVYEILSIRDGVCPGSVDSSANTFQVSWIPRPTLQIIKDATFEEGSGRYAKKSVCEGDQDSLEISMTGSPPYHVKYEIRENGKLKVGSSNRDEKKIGLHRASIKMETSKPSLYEYTFTELGDQLYEHRAKRFTPLIAQQRVHGRPSASFVNSGKMYRYCKEQVNADETIPITLRGTAPFSLELGIKHHATVKPEIITIPNVPSDRYEFRMPSQDLPIGTHTVTIRKVSDSNGCQKITEFDGPAIRVNVVDVPNIIPVEAATDYCVGDRISFTLTGTPPFNVFYTFEGAERKASSSTTTFRRIAERPGNFMITAISDKASTDTCRARTEITKVIHGLPSVRISRGRTAKVDIHEGGEADILFEFGGTPPFKFTYTRSTNGGKGRKSVVLETKNDISYEHIKSIRVSEEGTYEVVSIRDRYCGVSAQNVVGKSSQHLLTF